ncbi:SdrD B-like domain-containing protein, partial [Microbacterium sp.]|uniref:DUF7507 domain-containing protein n=1 Tax=Microbacterium sp. TaxID=51671 RepID=UPI0031FE9140|nr:hypothetical protein [Microbacterium sp.]
MTASISVSLLLVLSAVVALGVHGNGAFELDGNSVPDTSADDWDDISNGADVALVTTGIVPDEYGASKEDDQFTLGSKDTQDVSEWDWKAAVPPSDKTDLQNAYAALYDVGGELYLFLGADRDATNGNAKLGFWIFQDEIGKNADGTFSGEHKEGDLLIESAYTAGGTELGNINVWQWQGGDGTAGALSAAPIIVGADCRVNPAPVSDAVICSINNDEEITVDWAYQGKKLANDTPDPSHIFAGGFNETGIKLSHFFPTGIPCFSSILAETRAAGSSVDSATEDLVLGTFETCGNIDAHKYLDLDGNGQLDSGEPDLEGWTINLYESDGTTLIDSQGTDSDGNVSFEDLEAGDYVVCEEIESDTPAWVNSDPGDGTLCKDVTLDLGGSETVQFGNGQPDISITKTCTADVFVGDDIEYEITVTNTGNVDLVDVDVTDTLLTLTGADDLTLAAGASITFEPTLEATTTGTVNNTASVSGDFGGTTVYATVSDSANCATKVHELTVTKDATATWQRTYTWTIEKSVTPSSAEIFENDIQELDYTIDVTRSVSADAYALSGTITVSNPAPIAASLSSVTDSADGSTQTVMCPALTVPAADNGTPGELECTYSGSIPDASGTNTATATMTNGTQESGTANYSVASPTSEVAASASVDDVQSADTGLDFDCIAGTCSWPQNVSGSTQFTYTKEASSADAGVYDLDNTATVTFTGGSDSDSETATITVHALDV